MASEFVSYYTAGTLCRESAIGHDPNLVAVRSGDAVGVALPKLTNQGYTFISQIPGSLTVATGLTFTVGLTDDGVDASDLGKVVRLGFTIKRIVNDETFDIDASAATEVTLDVTLSSTTGAAAVSTKAITLLDSTAAGELFMIRVRRLSTATQDTANGRVILMFLSVKNT